MDTRVQDYLDDRLQSTADLESLDTLLADVKRQQELLKKQVSVMCYSASTWDTELTVV